MTTKNMKKVLFDPMSTQGWNDRSVRKARKRAMRQDLEESAAEVFQTSLYTAQEKLVQSGNENFSETRDQQRAKKRKITPRMWRLFLMGGDGILLVLLLVLFLALLPYLHIAPGSSAYDLGKWNAKLMWGFLALLSWSLAAKLAQAEDPANATGRLKSVISVLLALMLTFLFWMVLTYPFIMSGGISYLEILLYFLVITAPILCLWRVIFAEIIILPRFRSRAIIVGANAAGATIARELSRARRLRVIALGYIDDGSVERPREDVLPILGGRTKLRHLLQDGAIDMIITAIDYHARPELFQDVIDAAQQGIAVLPMTIAYESVCGKLPVEHVGDQWYAAHPSIHVVSPFYLCWHKVMDITFGLVGMAVLLLILPVLAMLIYLDSPGPIFYHQERLGYRGRTFSIHKFRSMRTNAEQAGQAMWASEQDTRVTGIGRFMRATHLDELPQVFNILCGDMSLIGPRPERQEFVTELEKTIPYYRCRLMVKPGLTGWAQVKYRYANTDLEALEKLQYDLYYIRHRSFMLDISIILQTVIEVLWRRGV